jgi:hypothetical protein
MARHVREGRGLCPIQVTNSGWNEDLEKIQTYIVKSMSLPRIGSSTLTFPEGFPHVLRDCSSKQAITDHLGF